MQAKILEIFHQKIDYSSYSGLTEQPTNQTHVMPISRDLDSYFQLWR